MRGFEGVWAKATLVSLLVLLAAPASAEGPGPYGSPGASRQQEAEFQRQRAEAGARADLNNLGYPNPYQNDYPPRETDFVALSMQIEALAAHMRALAAEQASQSMAPAAVPGLDLPQAGSGVAATYGPDGPTPKSVRMVLDYRLLLAGNPRLRSGAITDRGDAVSAQIITADGAVVDEFLVDKRTGVWTPQR